MSKRSIIAAQTKQGEWDLVAKTDGSTIQFSPSVQDVAQIILTRMLQEGLIAQHDGVYSFTEQAKQQLEGRANG